MIILEQLKEQLHTLTGLLSQLSKEQYTYKSRYLANATIGGHSRHIIELLQCAVIGYYGNYIDYINRQRNLSLENNIDEAIAAVLQLLDEVNLSDKALTLFCEDNTTIVTTYYRELVYNVEHIIHHLALIKVSLVEMNLEIVDQNFGMAYSTIQYKDKLQNA